MSSDRDHAVSSLKPLDPSRTQPLSPIPAPLSPLARIPDSQSEVLVSESNIHRGETWTSTIDGNRRTYDVIPFGVNERTRQSPLKLLVDSDWGSHPEDTSQYAVIRMPELSENDEYYYGEEARAARAELDSASVVANASGESSAELNGDAGAALSSHPVQRSAAAESHMASERIQHIDLQSLQEHAGPDQQVDNAPAPPVLRNIHWQGLRNLKWTPTFYNTMHAVLKSGPLHRIPEAERRRIARSVNSKRFFEYAQHFSLQNDKVVLADYNIPTWAVDKQGRQIAQVALPVVYHVIQQADIRPYLKQAYSNVANNAYRGVSSFYNRISMETIGISRSDVEHFVADQEISQLRMNIFSRRQGLVVQPLRPTAVMEHWQADLVDVTNFAHWNGKTRFLLVVIDIFSKYVHVAALKSKHSNRVAFALQLMFLQDGAPRILQTDNGSEFRNGDVIELSKRWSFEMRHGLPYKSTTNGGVERVNRTIENAIQSHMVDYQTKRYLDVLPFICFSYNTTVHSTHSFQPFLVHKGRAANPPSSLWSTFDSSRNVQDDDMPDEPSRRDAAADIPAEEQGVAEQLEAHISRSLGPNHAPARRPDGEEKEQINSHPDAMDMDSNPVDYEPLVEDIRDYVERNAALATHAQDQVASRINAKADAMIHRSAKNYHAKTPRLEVGDKVRLDALALTQHRRVAKNAFKKPMDLPNWSTIIFTVQARTDATRGSPDMYTLVDDAGNPPEAESRRRQYFRYQLMLVHPEHMDRLHDNNEKPDWNFGVLYDHDRGRRRPNAEAQAVSGSASEPSSDSYSEEEEESETSPHDPAVVGAESDSASHRRSGVDSSDERKSDLKQEQLNDQMQSRQTPKPDRLRATLPPAPMPASLRTQPQRRAAPPKRAKGYFTYH